MKRKKKKRKTIPVPVASMGDIAFLLIIFFLVCSESIKDKSNLQIELPISEHVKKPEITVVAYISIDENGELYFDGLKVESAKDIEWGVRALLTNSVSDDQRHVQFKCDKSQSKEVFQPVLQAIAEAGGIIEAVGELEQ
jgi:biopolymer transport protein ExbD